MEKEEAIEVVKKNYPHVNESGSQFETALRTLIPELAESGDEKIRNFLIDFIKVCSWTEKKDQGWPLREECIAWLEKQGERKLIDKIQLGKKYKCIASPRYSTFTTGKIYKPENKFLCSLMNFCSDCFEPIEDGKQEPAWSEEDEKNINLLCELLTELQVKSTENEIKYGTNNLSKYYHDTKEWLKSFKNRVQSQPKQEWSEEDERLFQIVIDVLDRENHLGNITHTDLISCVRKLKSLKDRYTWKPSKEQIIALRWVLNNVPYNNHKEEISGLLDQIKDL